jgi:hypothetical protein
VLWVGTAERVSAIVHMNRPGVWIMGDLADHPLHLHRHSFEMTRVGGKPTAGVIKDVVMLGGFQEIEFDFVADNPGLTLFHCHQQLHMDFGFMALFKRPGIRMRRAAASTTTNSRRKRDRSVGRTKRSPFFEAWCVRSARRHRRTGGSRREN